MNDFTKGSIPRHLIAMAVFIGMGLAFQAAYFLIDLYFVAALGPDTIAGVGAAGNTSFLVMAATQLVGVGVTSLIARAVGKRDMNEARLVFNQAVGMAGAASLVTLVGGYLAARPMIAQLAASAGSAHAGVLYLYGFMPGLAAMFPMTVLVAGLRGAGIARPTMIVQTSSLLLNAILAPVLIAGWFTHHPLGAFGAGLASSIAGLCALIGLALAFPHIQQELRLLRAQLAPRLRIWWQIVRIGLPVAAEFGMMFVITSFIYWVIRHFGAPAQAGFGIGSRIMTSIFLPAMAVAFAVAPVAGQNMGAGRTDRVRATGWAAAAMSSGLMLVLSLVCHWRPGVLIAVFTSDPAVTHVAAQYLSILSWNFVAAGLIYVCSGLFQAMGNTLPSFLSSTSRLLTYVLPILFIEGRPGIDLHVIWYMSVASTTLQALFSLLLLRREFRRRLGKLTPAAGPVPAPLTA